MTSNPLCPVCADEVFMGFHPQKKTPVLVITDDPEIEDGKLSPAIQMIRSEMAREHMDLYSFGYMPLYRHFIPKNTKNIPQFRKKECLAAHTQWLFDEIKNYQLIFASGVDIVKLLTRQSSQAVSSLVIQSEILSPEKTLVCAISPRQAWAMTVGEMRLAIQTLAIEFNKIKGVNNVR